LSTGFIARSANGCPIWDVELLTDERGTDPVRENVPDALRKAMRNW